MPISLPVISANYGLVLIITSEVELEISRACCANVLIEKGLKRGHKMHSGYLENMTGFELKKALSLDKFEIASKSKIK